MILELEGKRFTVDFEKNKAYYTTHSLCDCVGCRNFYRQAEGRYPLLKEFLERFGVDISKPDEISWSDITEDSLDYIAVYYTVGGKMLDTEKYEMDIADTAFLNLVIENGYVPNNRGTEDYFVISVYGLCLPYILDEPFTEKKTIKTKFVNFFKRRKKS